MVEQPALRCSASRSGGALQAFQQRRLPDPLPDWQHLAGPSKSELSDIDLGPPSQDWGAPAEASSLPAADRHAPGRPHRRASHCTPAHVPSPAMQQVAHAASRPPLRWIGGPCAAPLGMQGCNPSRQYYRAFLHVCPLGSPATTIFNHVCVSHVVYGRASLIVQMSPAIKTDAPCHMPSIEAMCPAMAMSKARSCQGREQTGFFYALALHDTKAVDACSTAQRSESGMMWSCNLS